MFISYHDLTCVDCFAQETLRRRFGNALQWYYALVNATDHHIQDLLEQARSTVVLNEQTHDDNSGDDLTCDFQC
jgi:hypothetical protein